MTGVRRIGTEESFQTLSLKRDEKLGGSQGWEAGDRGGIDVASCHPSGGAAGINLTSRLNFQGVLVGCGYARWLGIPCVGLFIPCLSESANDPRAPHSSVSGLCLFRAQQIPPQKEDWQFWGWSPLPPDQDRACWPIRESERANQLARVLRVRPSLMKEDPIRFLPAKRSGVRVGFQPSPKASGI